MRNNENQHNCLFLYFYRRKIRVLCGYVIQTLEDYIEAAEQEDTVLMLDTLDYGLRELVDIYREDDEAIA